MSRQLPAALRPFADRFLFAGFRTFSLLATYFPSNKAKVPLFEALHRESPVLVAEPLLLVGDFNTGRHHVDEARATFVAADLFASLQHYGWHDAWRGHHPDVREFSWYSSRGNGFRIDHAFLSPSLTPMLEAVSYDHSTRTSNASDHSALHLRIAAEA